MPSQHFPLNEAAVEAATKMLTTTASEQVAQQEARKVITAYLTAIEARVEHNEYAFGGAGDWRAGHRIVTRWVEDQK